MAAESYWGELYLRSTLPFLSAETTRREAEYLARVFERDPGPIVDFGCGHGRHLSAMAPSFAGRLVGLELDRASLNGRGAGFAAVQADFRAPPLRDGSVGGAFAWYSTLFIHDDATNARTLRAVARTLRPGATLVLHTVPYERLARAPTARFERTLDDGSRLVEESRFDAVTGRDVGTRQLTTPDQRVLSGTYTIRYYPLPELLELLWAAGMRLRWAHGDLDGAPLSPESTDLIVAAERTHA